ncbi:MAG: OmpP1/FadL family transporter [Verrucomicrobiaceae bacterium]
MSKATLIFILTVISAQGNGVLRWGFGADDLASAGAFGVTGGSALTAIQGNPAILGSLDRETVASLRFLDGEADFTRAGITSSLRDGQGVYPDLAFSWKTPESPWTWGAGLSVISGLEANWLYQDTPGGIGGISFGTLPHESRYTAIRLSAGAGYQVNDDLALGLSIGMVRSEVLFDAPFIFQTNPALKGAKVDLLMGVEDWAPTLTLGAVYQVSNNWTIGLDITPQIPFDHHGYARADYSAQLPPLGFAGAPPIAEYAARVRNELPLKINLGSSWQVNDQLSLGFRADRIQWADSYDRMRVDLSNGSNPTINGAIGSQLWDEVPLRWKNRWALSFGARYQLSSEWTLLGGYRYAKSPIPDEFVTPLNGAILEQAITLGLGWHRDDWDVNLGWAHEFGPSVNVATSGYQAGEYSNSSLDVKVDHLSLSIRRQF